MFRDKSGVAMRDLIEQTGGTYGYANKVVAKLLQEKKISPFQFSFKEIWEACELVEYGHFRPLQEAVSSDMFPKITGELINSTLIQAYNVPNLIGDQLTTTMSSNVEDETIAGFTATEGSEEVQQGRDYNDSNFSEKWAGGRNLKYGRIINITEETIYFDKTGQILLFAQGIGNKLALRREKLIVEGVQDINSNVYKPFGVSMAFYRTAEADDTKGYAHRINSKASNPFGEDGLTQAFVLMHNMKDEEGDPILISPGNLIGLFPQNLWTQALQMVQSGLTPESMENAKNIFKRSFTPLTSPYVTGQSADTWYLGNFSMDFIWSEVWPLQTFTAKPGALDKQFTADIKSSHKVRFYGAIIPRTDIYSYKFTA